jgi:aspartyl-tRNA(Asn)/glutamyl-tRNA(Gln) amidotransferase subunit A
VPTPLPPITDLARQLRNGGTTAVELVERCLDAIATQDGTLNAFISVLADEARIRAVEADRELAAGHDLGALHGIPVSVKDLIDLRGQPTTAASRVRKGHRAPGDAPVVARLRAAGAIFIGKCNLHEFAFGITGEDSAYGPTRNPHAPDRVAGGSSSGSAVSVTTGMAAASVGSDTGGSIRIPAAACGVVGLKPTFGDISCDGVFPLGTTLDHVGPIGLTVDDVAIMYRVMGGDTVGRGCETAASDLTTPVRLGLPRRYFLDILDDEVRSAFAGALERLASAGCQIIDVDLPHADSIADTYRNTVLWEAAAIHRSTLEAQPEDYTPGVRRRLEMGLHVSEATYRAAQQTRELHRRDVDTVLADVRALVLPTLPIPAPPLGLETLMVGDTSQDIRALMLRLTQLFDLTGHPAVSIPSGTTRQGLPCALQLVGSRNQTLELLTLASRYEPDITRQSLD